MGPRNEPTKHRRAVALLEELDFGISAQVIQEFCVNIRRKADPQPSPERLAAWIDWLAERPVVPVDIDLVRAGLAYSDRFQISYWDGAIVAAAEQLGAPVLYSEDLNHGQSYGPVLVQNPFRGL